MVCDLYLNKTLKMQIPQFHHRAESLEVGRDYLPSKQGQKMCIFTNPPWKVLKLTLPYLFPQQYLDRLCSLRLSKLCLSPNTPNHCVRHICYLKVPQNYTSPQWPLPRTLWAFVSSSVKSVWWTTRLSSTSDSLSVSKERLKKNARQADLPFNFPVISK